MKQGLPPDGPLRMSSAGPISYRRLLRWSIVIVGGAPRLFVASVLLGLLSILLTQQYAVVLLARILDALKRPDAGNRDLVLLALLFLAISLLGIASGYAGRIIGIRARGAMTVSLQQRLHDGLLTMAPSYHQAHDIGEIRTIVMMYAPGTVPALSDLVAYPVTQGIALASALGILLSSLRELHDIPVMAEVALGSVLIALPPIVWWFARRRAETYRRVQPAQFALETEFANSLTTPVEVRTLGAQPQRTRAFRRALSDLMPLKVRADIESATAGQFQLAVPELMQAGFLTYAAVAAAAVGAKAAAPILLIYYFVPQVVRPLQSIVDFVTNLQPTWPLVVPVGVILDAPVQPMEGASVTEGPPFAVTLDHVTYTFPNAPGPLLRGLSHIFPAGRVSALVASSGGGKSTLVSLIGGLREPTSGVVRVGGAPVQALSEAALRAAVAVVSQTPLFITDTVRANFQLARASATDAEIEAAARAAGLWPALVKQGPMPLDTIVTRDPGQGLSGGERRRLALARILLQTPKVLVLDEPTTGVDTESIGVLIDAIRNVARDMTVILVEHNLDVVRALADEVCCLQDGMISDVGTPEELAARPSVFKALLDERERWKISANMQLINVKPPTIAAGPDIDPWANAKDAAAVAPKSAGAMLGGTPLAVIADPRYIE